MDTRKKLAELEEEIQKKNQKTPDEIVLRVRDLMNKRSIKGIAKYKTTLYSSDEGLLAFLNHAQEELIDGALYLEKIKEIING